MKKLMMLKMLHFSDAKTLLSTKQAWSQEVKQMHKRALVHRLTERVSV